MLTSTLLMPVSDPTQVKQQRIMGVGMAVAVTVFMFTGWPRSSRLCPVLDVHQHFGDDPVPSRLSAADAPAREG